MELFGYIWMKHPIWIYFLNREVARNEKGYSATKPLVLVDMQIRHLPRYPPGPAKNPLNHSHLPRLVRGLVAWFGILAVEHPSSR
jgi:hypothetical protein